MQPSFNIQVTKMQVEHDDLVIRNTAELQYLNYKPGGFRSLECFLVTYVTCALHQCEAMGMIKDATSNGNDLYSVEIVLR